MSSYVAESVKIIEDSGLDYEIHAMRTLIEGPSEAVIEIIGKCHENLASKCDRVATNIKIDDRKGAQGSIKRKVHSVREKLGEKM